MPLRVSVQSSWDGQKMKTASISSRGLALCDMFRELTCEELELNASIMNWFRTNKGAKFKRDSCNRRKTSRIAATEHRPRNRMDKKSRRESRSGWRWTPPPDESMPLPLKEMKARRPIV